MTNMTIEEFTSYTTPCDLGGVSLDARKANGQTMKDTWNNSINGLWLLWILRSHIRVDKNVYNAERLEAYDIAKKIVRGRTAKGGQFQRDRDAGILTDEEIDAGNAFLLQMADDIRSVVDNPFE